MTTRYKISLALSILCAVVLCLMGGEEPAPDSGTASPAASDQAKQPAAAEASPAADEKPQAAEDDAPSAEEVSAEADRGEESQTLVFDAPFPDRVNLFQAPKREGRESTSKLGQIETEVKLLGFVHVNEPRVLLSIGGVATTIPEGGVERGIQVVTIKNPSVILKRAQQRSGSWVLSTEF